jgi:hypothetical protein
MAIALLVDSVAFGDRALVGPGATQLPTLDAGEEWLTFRIQVRYVGTGTRLQVLRASDLLVVYQRDGNNYEAPLAAGWPSLEAPIESDVDVGLTF